MVRRTSSPSPPHADSSSWTMLAISSLLALTLGVGLAIFHYHQQSRVILTTGETLFTHIQQQIEQDLLGLYHPPAQALNLLALGDLAASNLLEERLQQLPMLAQALEDNPQLNSLYHAWADGDYMMLRPLRSAALKARFNAPSNAAWMVWYIERGANPDADSADATYLFLDYDLKGLEERAVTYDGFDPRHRPWFSKASAGNSHIITTPYIFFSTSEFGTTLARPTAQGGVIGADLTLDRLSHTLANLQITENSQLLLYDPEGTVIAYQDVNRILATPPGTGLRLKGFRELGSTLLARLAEDGFQQQRTLSLTLEGQRWSLSQSRLAVAGLPETYLAILVPEQELLKEAYLIRRHSVWITLTASLLILPLIWLAIRRILRPAKSPLP